MAPRSNARVHDPWRLVMKLVIFGAAVAALFDADQTALAVVMAGATAAHLALTFALGQRHRPNAELARS